MTEPWWDKIMPLIVTIKLIYYSIPILVLIFVVSIYKDVKKILPYLHKNEKKINK
ncbi:Uncharacterized [Syntrophomonas zehnderi OL-4]|uniref:Uncharacterized n=1 Tax=Syntrophomonas zehnderi OL-4 TaxID=690567 RepID=A0A0E3W2P7_9FIRM|nr:Uncharacterized [Syntrophomonas zehnderi OL-4]